MAPFKKRRRFRSNRVDRHVDRLGQADLPSSEGTGSEATNLRSLVDSREKVTVVFQDGEHLRGRVRYYDRDTFSIGPAGGGPKILLRKNGVLYISED
ncbi:MAG: hypothetical protein FJW35_16545 [Acidobacteria bacterium]|nr:hypothetical protein [Acidobacteriota bacterium]